MADTTHVTYQDWLAWCQTSKSLDDSIAAKLTGLTVAQKQNLSGLIDKWVSNLKP